MKRCFNCFGQFKDEFNVCPHCGTVEITEPEEPIYLYPGTVILDRYVIGNCVGAGGFGIVYKAWDIKLETIVAIKEFFPTILCTRAERDSMVAIFSNRKEEFDYRKGRFLLEARSMAKFGEHKNIPNVFDFFEENNTAYIVMELLVGEQVSDYMKKCPGGKVNVDFAVHVANEVGKALESMHEAKIIHRDVAPDNIFICEGKNLRVKLMDLGAAKIENSSDDVIDLCMKVGYSPVEQYDKVDNFGPWSDVYALGATLYHMLTGVKPFESTSRKKEDMLEQVSRHNPDVSVNLNNSIMKAMAINPNERFKNIPEFLKAINGEKKVLSLEKEKRKKKSKIALGVACGIIAAGGAGFFAYNKFSEKRENQYLKPATISIWYLSGTDNPLEEQSLQTVKESFNKQTGYSEVTIEIKSFSNEKEYLDKLYEAAAMSELPNVFEYIEGTDSSVMDKVLREKDVIADAVSTCSLLSQYEGYGDEKLIPMAIEIPMGYVFVKGPNAIEYASDYFSAGSELENMSVYLNTDKELMRKNLTSDNYVESDLSGLTGSTVIFASNSSYNEVKNVLSEQWFAVKPVFFDGDKIECKYAYNFCITGSNHDEENAAEHFVAWMLGANAQTNMFSGTGLLPLNDKAFDKKVSGDNSIWKPLKDLHKKFNFNA